MLLSLARRADHKYSDWRNIWLIEESKCCLQRGNNKYRTVNRTIKGQDTNSPRHHESKIDKTLSEIQLAGSLPQPGKCLMSRLPGEQRSLEEK